MNNPFLKGILIGILLVLFACPVHAADTPSDGPNCEKVYLEIERNQGNSGSQPPSSDIRQWKFSDWTHVLLDVENKIGFSNSTFLSNIDNHDIPLRQLVPDLPSQISQMTLNELIYQTCQAGPMRALSQAKEKTPHHNYRLLREHFNEKSLRFWPPRDEGADVGNSILGDSPAKSATKRTLNRREQLQEAVKQALRLAGINPREHSLLEPEEMSIQFRSEKDWRKTITLGELLNQLWHAETPNDKLRHATSDPHLPESVMDAFDYNYYSLHPHSQESKLTNFLLLERALWELTNQGTKINAKGTVPSEVMERTLDAPGTPLHGRLLRHLVNDYADAVQDLSSHTIPLREIPLAFKHLKRSKKARFASLDRALHEDATQEEIIFAIADVIDAFPILKESFGEPLGRQNPDLPLLSGAADKGKRVTFYGLLSRLEVKGTSLAAVLGRGSTATPDRKWLWLCSHEPFKTELLRRGILYPPKKEIQPEKFSTEPIQTPLESLYELFQQICDEHFDGNPDNMTLTALRQVGIRIPDGEGERVVSGLHIHNTLGEAIARQWRTEVTGRVPEAQIYRSGMGGLTQSKSRRLGFLRLSLTKECLVGRRENRTIEVPFTFLEPLFAEIYLEKATSPPELRLKFEEVFDWILKNEFDGDVGAMTPGRLWNSTIVDPNGKRHSGQELMSAYFFLKPALVGKMETSIITTMLRLRPNKSDRSEWTNPLFAFNHFRVSRGWHLKQTEGRSPSDSTQPTTAGENEDVVALARTHGLTPLLEKFRHNPVLLIEVLRTVHGDIFENRDVTDFVQRYVGLEVESDIGQGAGPSSKSSLPQTPENRAEQRRSYIDALIGAIRSGRQVGAKEQLTSLLIKLTRLNFQTDPQATLTELRATATKLESDPPDGLTAEQGSMLADIHRLAVEHFESQQKLKIQGMKTPPFGFQKEGVKFLIDHDAAILADEVGLGKTYEGIAAVETLRAREEIEGRVLWVTTAPNVRTVEGEILTHTSEVGTNDVMRVIAGNVAARTRQLRKELPDAKYIVVSYDLLEELHTNNRPVFDQITKGVDIAIFDEAQVADNPKSSRSQAIRDVKARKKWMLSATPYQNRLENLFTSLNILDPHIYSDKRAFVDNFTRDTAGLINLNLALKNIMLRRTKEETLMHFESPEVRPFSEQLTNGIGRIPRKDRLTPEQAGTYQLLPEQTELIARMIEDFPGWAEEYNRNRRKNQPVCRPTPLQKFRWIQRVINEPRFFGIKKPNPLLKALDKVVQQKMKDGEKLILWGFHNAILDRITERYRKKYGANAVVEFRGTAEGTNGGRQHLTARAKHEAKEAFQDSDEVRIIVANYRSAAVGLTLTAGRTALFVELPRHFQELYQAEGRHHRVIGPNNVDKAKETVESIMMVGRYDPDVIATLNHPRTRQHMLAGTIPEQTFKRSAGGELIFNMVMAGFGRPQDIENFFRHNIFQSLGMNDTSDVQARPYLPDYKARLMRTAEIAIPLWDEAQRSKHSYHKEEVDDLIHLASQDPRIGIPVIVALQNRGTSHLDDVGTVLQIYRIKNSYIRQETLKRLPMVLARLYEKGRSLSDEARAIDMDTLTPTDFLGRLLVQGSSQKFVQKISEELMQLPNSPATIRLHEKFHSGLIAVENTAAQAVMEANSTPMGQMSLADKVETIYKLGLIQQLAPDKMENTTFSHASALRSHIDSVLVESLGRLAGVNADKIAEFKTRTENAEEVLNAFSALGAGYGRWGDPRILVQYQEALGHVFNGTYHDWRYSQNKKSGGNVEYLADRNDFWEILAENSRSETSGTTNNDATRQFAQDLARIRQSFLRQSDPVEGQQTQVWVHEYVNKSDSHLSSETELRNHARVLGAYLRKPGISRRETKNLFKQYDIPLDTEPATKALVRDLVSQINNTIKWFDLRKVEQVYQEGKPLTPQSLQTLKGILKSKANIYTRFGNPEMASHFVDLLERTAKQGPSPTDKFVTTETDAPQYLARMGALSCGMVNCFNPDGSPEFNQHVVGVLGSKNMKMLVVTNSKGLPVASAIYKVRRLEDGRPVLFLEAGSSEGTYDFRPEMLELLKAKAKSIREKTGLEVFVMDQIPGVVEETDPIVLGTGAFTSNEYVEAVFGLRKSDKVRHRGRVVDIK